MADVYLAISTSQVVAMKRPTKTLLLDAAEELFADKGYKATSMEDISSAVGIRPSAIYKHFKNKQELYEAVLDRMVQPFFAMLERFAPDTQAIDYVSTIFNYHIAHPTLAKFALHATLRGGEQRQLLLERWFNPFWARSLERVASSKKLGPGKTDHHRSIFMAFNHMMLGYVAMAPLNESTLGFNPLEAGAISSQVSIMTQLAESLLDAGAADPN
jgi:TetR/AcrR family transcriptional regulator